MFLTCCSETICQGCIYANFMANKHDKVKALSCPFCREPADDEENDKRNMIRIEANDPAAMRQVGGKCYDKGDYDGALGYFTKAAELGNSEAHQQLGTMYMMGEGVEEDEKRAVHHWEKAAIGGHPIARHNLAVIEERNGNMGRAVKHFIIAANLGNVGSMKGLWKHYSRGNITKEDLDATLRSHQAAIDATMSTQRKTAEGVFRGLLHK
jgi:TPR repeat protein